VDDYPIGTFLFTMLVCFAWFAAIFMFIAIFIDIIRRRMSGWAKAGWIVLIVVLPLIGALIYLIARPKHGEVAMMPSASGTSRHSMHAMHHLIDHDAGSEIARGAQEYAEGIQRRPLG
jgi:hypothetical protein